jgi:hypothetical protein
VAFVEVLSSALRLMCASAHLSSPTRMSLALHRAWESAMNSTYYENDETCPEHEHHSMIAAILITFPVMILVSVIGTLFGMA